MASTAKQNRPAQGRTWFEAAVGNALPQICTGTSHASQEPLDG
jgi:hypothetical protein